MTSLHFPMELHVGDFSLMARPLEKEDIPQFYALILANGWPSTDADVRCMFEQNPGQMFGLFDDRGRLLSTCLGTKWSDEEAYIMFFITVEEYQRRGLGSAVFKLMMRSLGDRNVTLFAVDGTPPMYKKLGLGIMGDVYILRCEGRLKSLPTKQSEAIGSPALNIETVNKTTVMSVSDYEKSVSGLKRTKLFSDMLSVPGSYCFRAVSKDDATVIGYITAQTMNKTLFISGLHADGITAARALLEALISTVSNTCQGVGMFLLEGTFGEFAPLLQQHVEVKVTHKSQLLATKHLPEMQWKKVFVFNEMIWSTTH